MNAPLPAQNEMMGLSYESIFVAEIDYVCRSLRRLGVRAADVEDVAQEIFVLVYKKRGTIDLERPIRPLLFSYAIRAAANYRRLIKHREETFDSIDVPASADLADEHVRRDLVLRILARLPLERATVLVLHDIEGFAVEEISKQLGINSNTIYSRLRAARIEFEAALAWHGVTS